MKISELVEKKLIPADHWLTKAKTENEDVEIENGSVIWENGIWENGVWKNGIWEYGQWKRGIWEHGVWKNGIWGNGTWGGGEWGYGVWRNGTWAEGLWKDGIWESGVWKRGIWEDGVWRNGTWKRGIWKNGYRKVGQCFWDVYYSHSTVKIGCEEKTVSEWDEWFAGEEVFETSRTDPAFKLIEHSYKLAKFALELNGGAK